MSTDRSYGNGERTVQIDNGNSRKTGPAAGKIRLIAGWIEVLLGLTFILSATLKALDIDKFAVQVWYYGVIREPILIRFAALATVLVETSIGIALLVGWRLRGWTLSAVFAMLAGFTGR